jgi:photosystem II stability/assembly factor-like uncharacterized protein
VVNGAAAGEYFASGVRGGVIHSVDGGQTWSAYNAGLPPAELSFTNQITVSPTDGSKYLDAGLVSGAGSVEVWYHP